MTCAIQNHRSWSPFSDLIIVHLENHQICAFLAGAQRVGKSQSPCPSWAWTCDAGYGDVDGGCVGCFFFFVGGGITSPDVPEKKGETELNAGKMSRRMLEYAWSWFGYGSIPINTIFSGMNIHLPAILMWTTGVQGFDTLPFWNK